LYKQFINNNCTATEKRYKNYKNKLTALLRSCEKTYYSNLLDINKHDIKKTWMIINGLMNKNKNSSRLPSEFVNNNLIVTGDSNIANSFNDFFVNVGPNLAKKVNKPKSNIKFTDYMKTTINESIFLGPVTEEEILETVNRCKNKLSNDYIDVNMCLVKNVIRHIAQPLMHIFNVSFNTGNFPDCMKVAKVIPLYKAGDKQCFSNYRPVSLLPQFFKIHE